MLLNVNKNISCVRQWIYFLSFLSENREILRGEMFSVHSRWEGVDKSLARPGQKYATVTKLGDLFNILPTKLNTLLGLLL